MTTATALPRAARPATAAGFTPRTLVFLRALERHNTREWFRERKDRYEADVRAPMVAFVERFAVDLKAFAPDLLANPAVSLFRPYRDTRFSGNKAPIKTNVGALFPHRLLAKLEGAGLYMEVGPHHVWYGGGMYMPPASVVQREREHIAANYRRLTRIVASPSFRRTFGALEGERLQRMPRGFPADHPAGEFLKFRQFFAGCERPADFATTSGFYRTVLAGFKALAPLVDFLNEPLVARLRSGEPGHAWTGTGR